MHAYSSSVGMCSRILSGSISSIKIPGSSKWQISLLRLAFIRPKQVSVRARCVLALSTQKSRSVHRVWSSKKSRNEGCNKEMVALLFWGTLRIDQRLSNVRSTSSCSTNSNVALELTDSELNTLTIEPAMILECEQNNFLSSFDSIESVESVFGTAS